MTHPEPVGTRSAPHALGLRLGVVLSAVVLAVAACGGGTAHAPTQPATTGPAAVASAEPRAAAKASAAPSSTVASSLAWRACGGGLECASLSVPVDWTRPEADHLVLYLARLPATDPARRIGSLVVNFGGPGQPAIAPLRHGGAAALPASVRARFDIVAVDLRGTGLSSPLSCSSDAALDRWRALDPIARTPAERTALEDAARQFADDCEQHSGGLLPYMSTEANARDLGLVRAALGDDRLTYVGYSYGTILGSRYATRYPDRVRAMVLDAAVDPSLEWTLLGEEKAVAMEAALDRFLADCRARPDCQSHGGGDPAKAFDALMARTSRTPIPAGGGRTLGRGDAITAVAAHLVTAAWSGLAAGLAAAEAGDGSLLMAAADFTNGRDPYGAYDSSGAAGTATACMDEARARPTAAEAAALADRVGKAAPHFGPIYEVGCTFWPVTPSGAPPRVAAPAGTPLLVIGGTGDASTPNTWSGRMTATLGNAVLVTRVGEGHTTLADPENPCLGALTGAYLIELAPPATGTTCR